jgi:hypothetical protein
MVQINDAKIGTDLSCERAWAESSTSLEKLASAAAAECRADVQDASRGRAKVQREKSAVGVGGYALGRVGPLGLGGAQRGASVGAICIGCVCLSATRASQATGTSCTLG